MQKIHGGRHRNLAHVARAFVLALMTALAVVGTCSGLASLGRGPSVDPEWHLMGVCIAPSQSTAHDLPIRLAMVDLPPRDLSDVDAHRIALAGMDVDVNGRLLHLDDTRGVTEAVLDHAFAPGRSEALVWIDGGTPSTDVVALLEALVRGGVDSVHWVAHSYEPQDLVFPDPAFAARIVAEIPAEHPSRNTQLVDRVLELTALCPVASAAIDDALAGTVEARCWTLPRALDRALEACPHVDSDRVLTVMQLYLGPDHPLKPTALTLDLDRSAAPLELDPEQTWSEVLPALAADPAPSWLSVAADDQQGRP